MTPAARLAAALHAATAGLVDRETLVEVIALAAVAREHVLVIGPPGTAKSEAVRRVAAAIGGNTFEYLLGRFTEPSELFGPIDLRKLRDGVVETEVAGMLPEADVLFLDEVFLGSSAILNTLLGVLMERSFRRGKTRMDVPLRVAVGASNSIPDEPNLAAFADRFLLQLHVSPVADPRLEDLLTAGARPRPIIPPAGLDTLDAVTAAAAAMDPTPIAGELAAILRVLRREGLVLSDRRAVKLVRLCCAAAAMADRVSPTTADLWPVVFAVPGADAQELARDALRPWLEATASPTLPAAAEAASAGPQQRALRLADAGRALLAEPSGPRRILRIEGLLREIDAGFSDDAVPADLRAVRNSLQASLAASD